MSSVWTSGPNLGWRLTLHDGHNICLPCLPSWFQGNCCSCKQHNLILASWGWGLVVKGFHFIGPLSNHRGKSFPETHNKFPDISHWPAQGYMSTPKSITRPCPGFICHWLSNVEVLLTRKKVRFAVIGMSILSIFRYVGFLQMGQYIYIILTCTLFFWLAISFISFTKWTGELPIFFYAVEYVSLTYNMHL